MLHCVPPVGEVMPFVTAAGLLTVGAGDNVLRLVPPLIVTEEDCKIACNKLIEAAEAFVAAGKLEQETVS